MPINTKMFEKNFFWQRKREKKEQYCCKRCRKKDSERLRSLSWIFGSVVAS